MKLSTITNGGMKILAFFITMLILNSFLLTTNLKAETFKVTAYCSCKKCCNKDRSNKWYGITSTGKKAKWGTVAVDKKVIKMGSRLVIEGFPNTTFKAEDVGGKIKGKHIDIWFPSHKKAKKFGVQKRNVFNFDDFLFDIQHSQNSLVKVEKKENNSYK